MERGRSSKAQEPVFHDFVTEVLDKVVEDE
jgi:hypothetical protein